MQSSFYRFYERWGASPGFHFRENQFVSSQSLTGRKREIATGLRRSALAVWIRLITSETEINCYQKNPKQGQKCNHCQLGRALSVNTIDYEAK